MTFEAAYFLQHSSTRLLTSYRRLPLIRHCSWTASAALFLRLDGLDQSPRTPTCPARDCCLRHDAHIRLPRFSRFCDRYVFLARVLYPNSTAVTPLEKGSLLQAKASMLANKQSIVNRSQSPIPNPPIPPDYKEGCISCRTHKRKTVTIREDNNQCLLSPPNAPAAWHIPAPTAPRQPTTPASAVGSSSSISDSGSRVSALQCIRSINPRRIGARARRPRRRMHHP